MAMASSSAMAPSTGEASSSAMAKASSSPIASSTGQAWGSAMATASNTTIAQSASPALGPTPTTSRVPAPVRDPWGIAPTTARVPAPVRPPFSPLRGAYVVASYGPGYDPRRRPSTARDDPLLRDSVADASSSPKQQAND